MQINLYSVFDIQAETFGQPFLMQTDGLAIRSFQEAAKNPQTEISKYPDDYSLYHLGLFDDDSGLFTQAEPKRLCSARSAIKMFTQTEE